MLVRRYVALAGKFVKKWFDAESLFCYRNKRDLYRRLAQERDMTPLRKQSGSEPASARLLIRGVTF